eukprot:7390940-Prymnesium_polylepis.2
MEEGIEFEGLGGAIQQNQTTMELHNVSSVTKCIVQCQMQSGCVAFRWKATSKTCRLLSAPYCVSSEKHSASADDHRHLAYIAQQVSGIVDDLTPPSGFCYAQGKASQRQVFATAFQVPASMSREVSNMPHNSVVSTLKPAPLPPSQQLLAPCLSKGTLGAVNSQFLVDQRVDCPVQPPGCFASTFLSLYQQSTCMER